MFKCSQFCVSLNEGKNFKISLELSFIPEPLTLLGTNWLVRFARILPNCRFSYAETWEAFNLLGQKILATIFVMKTGRKHKIPILKSRLQETDRSWTDSTEQYASKEECIKSSK